MNLKSERLLVSTDTTTKAAEIPDAYSAVKFDCYKSRTPFARMKPETEMEKRIKARKWERNNDPSPFSYNTEKSYLRLSNKDASNEKHTFSKMPKISFQVEFENRSKKIPSVGAYNIQKASENIYKPMRKR